MEIARLSELFEAVRIFFECNDGITMAELDVFLGGVVPHLGAKEYDALFDLRILDGIISDLYLGDVITVAVHIDSIYLKKG